MFSVSELRVYVLGILLHKITDYT